MLPIKAAHFCDLRKLSSTIAVATAALSDSALPKRGIEIR